MYSYSFSFLYHIVFNKRFSLPSDINSSFKLKYREQLLEIEKYLKINNLSDRNVFDLLSTKEYLPSGENYYRFILENPNIGSYLRELVPLDLKDDRFNFYIIRKWASKFETIIKETIIDYGFEIVILESLDEDQKYETISNLRGGIWDNVGFKIDGGDPYKILVCWNIESLRLPSLLKKKYPFTTNYSQVLLKKIIRNKIYSLISKSESAHFIHGPDSFFENNAYYNILNNQQKKMINEYLVTSNTIRSGWN
jgi:hypothetical protein